MHSRKSFAGKSILKNLISILKSIFIMIFSKGRNLKMGILSGNPQNEPLHYGEVFDIWSYLLAAQGNCKPSSVYESHR